METTLNQRQKHIVAHCGCRDYLKRDERRRTGAGAEEAAGVPAEEFFDVIRDETLSATFC